MTRKEIGKINAISIGYGGYDDAMIGITFELGRSKSGWGVTDFWGYWSGTRDSGCKWTEEDRERYLGKTVLRLNTLLREAKVNSVDKLRDVPVEATFEDNVLKSWRILTEVI